MIERADERELFHRAQAADEQRGDIGAREELVRRYERLALRLARRFAERGEAQEDLDQVARIGLLHSIRRFDPSRGVQFTTFATHTVLGELRKHFRDRAWGVHVPRSLQELNLLARRATEDLSQRLGRSPTIDEVASAIGRPRELALEALEIGQNAYELASLDDGAPDDEGTTTPMVELLIDTGIGGTRDFRELAEANSLLEALPPRMSLIVRWRHLDGLSQTEIARRLGISQMHVSRLYRRALDALHAMLDDEGDDRRGS
jgi:RNA polymerase sigma-B factor